MKLLNKTPQKNKIITYQNSSKIPIGVIENGNVSKDYLVYNENYFFKNSLNEFAFNIDGDPSIKWLAYRSKYLTNLNFKFSKAEVDEFGNLNVDSSSLNVAKKSNEKVFIYDYPWGYNYQHWFITSVSRLFLFIELRKFEPELKILIRCDENKYKFELLKILGLESSLLYFDENTEFERVYLPPFLSVTSSSVPDSVIQDYQSLSSLIDESEIPEYLKEIKRVYIARDDSLGRRPLKNRSELDALLNKYNYEKIYLENLNLYEKIYLFSNADFFIGDFSAGWGHSVLFKKKSKSILLEHDIYKNRNYYKGICHQCDSQFFVIENDLSKFRYLYIKVNKFIRRYFGKAETWADTMPWSINISKVESVLNKVDKIQ